ncbi:unnamed protein product [Amaranthus hypochondriacus]
MMEGLYYLVPELLMKDGLRKVVGEDKTFEIGQIAILCRCLDMYGLAKIPISKKPFCANFSITHRRIWPIISRSLIPPSIMIGPKGSRIKHRKDPLERPKKPVELSRNGTEMTCSLYKMKGHNKRINPYCGDKSE